MTKLKGLGKGLDALFESANTNIKNVYQQIALDKIQIGSLQPRKSFDENELNELALSIKQNGVLQPIIVRKLNNNFELIAGERRFRAAKIAKLDVIPVIVSELSNKEALAVALIENIQRKDLNVLEEALGYKKLHDEYSLTHENIANLTGKSRSHVTNTMRLLNLNDDVKQMLFDNKLDMGHARALLTLSLPKQLDIAKEIIANNYKTQDVEKLVVNLNTKKHKKKVIKDKFLDDKFIHDLEQKLADKFALNVKIKHSLNGSGTVEFLYESIDELENLMQFIK